MTKSIAVLQLQPTLNMLPYFSFPIFFLSFSPKQKLGKEGFPFTYAYMWKDLNFPADH